MRGARAFAESINVFVRVRPPLEAETLSDKSEEVGWARGPVPALASSRVAHGRLVATRSPPLLAQVVDVLGPKTISVASVRSSYDLVFGGEATQEEVYEAIKPSVEAVATVSAGARGWLQHGASWAMG